MRVSACLTGICLIVFISAAQAATPTDISRAETALTAEAAQRLRPNFRYKKPELIGQQAPPSPGDSDLGEQWILKEREKYLPFVFFCDALGFYTNNAALTRNNETGDALLFSQVGLSYQPRITDRLMGQLTIRQAFYRYNKLSVLDFNSLTVSAGLTYGMPRLWDICLNAGYFFNMLTDPGSATQFFRANVFTIGLEKAYVISQSHYVYAGYSSAFGLMTPNAAERDEHGFYAGYHVNITRALEAELFYRLAYFDYSAAGRNDLNQVLNLYVRYYFNKWLSVTASTSFAFNNSNTSVFDYTAINTGGGLSVNWRF